MRTALAHLPDSRWSASPSGCPFDQFTTVRPAAVRVVLGQHGVVVCLQERSTRDSLPVATSLDLGLPADEVNASAFREEPERWLVGRIRLDGIP
jgi:hypothetical protein